MTLTPQQKSWRDIQNLSKQLIIIIHAFNSYSKEDIADFDTRIRKTIEQFFPYMELKPWTAIVLFTKMVNY